MKNPKGPRRGQTLSELRIIGGRWRGRKITFTGAEGLRPTPDRVRETLFNWLAPVVVGARCLDLYSGSGALGMEALSRGARWVTFIEQRPEVASAIRQNLALLTISDDYCVEVADACRWLGTNEEPYDIVFIDPPFHKGLAERTLALLARPGQLRQGARIYLESEAAFVPALPSGWRLLRHKQAGQVAYGLLGMAATAG